jgi:endoglycosylceramidase
VRILITWDALEPEPGVYDEDYLPDIVEPQVAYAHDAGLRVILDMHQYHWSPCSGGMGMPEWICGDLGELPFQWLLQSGVFWNHPEYVDAFVAAWDKVAAHFAGDDRVFAYDLFNEPMAGLRTLPWTCENNLFRPLYLRLIETIRAHHVEPYLLVEPSIVTVAGFPSVMDPIDAERVVYAPHLYPGMLAEGGAYTFPYELLHRHMEKRTAESLRLGLPLLIGETGLRSSGENAEQYTRDATDLMEEKMAHWTWCAFGYDDDSMGLCYANGEPKEIFFPYLARPYPQATAGELRSFAFAFDTGVFNVSFANEAKLPPAVEIFVNAPYHYPDGFAVESTDPPGAWSYAFDEATSVVAVSCDPTALEHTITIRPADAR